MTPLIAVLLKLLRICQILLLRVSMSNFFQSKECFEILKVELARIFIFDLCFQYLLHGFIFEGWWTGHFVESALED